MDNLRALGDRGWYCAFPKGCEKLAGQKVANPSFFSELSV